MADAVLTAETRTETGKGVAGRFRKQGLVPAVVYGLGDESVSVTVVSRDLSHILSGASGSNTLITLRIAGSDQLALARQIQRDPIKGTVLHVDFVRVRADQTIQADVPVRLIGNAEGAQRGGVVEQMLFTLSVEARPADIPVEFEVDITALEIGDSIHIGGLPVPRGVSLNHEDEELVVQVGAPRVAEEEAAPVEGEAVEGEAGAAAPAAEGESSSEE